MAKKVLFITGTRADYGKLKPLMKKVDDSPGFELLIFVTGMHMLKRYGFTAFEIKRSGFGDNIIAYFNNQSGSLDMQISETIRGLSFIVKETEIDLIVVHGDRAEALAGAIVGSFNNILVAHIEGGEVSGTIDELIRHAVTKLSHVHFVSNKKAAERLIQMGEKRESIYTIGSPEVDIMISNKLPSIEEVKSRYDIKFDDYTIFLYHPVVTELDNLQLNISCVVSAIELSGQNYVVIYPNSDPGNEVIMLELERLKHRSNFKFIPSMRFECYLTLLKNARAIVGNSSSGVREASVYGVTAINLGSRQKNRSTSNNVINCNEHDTGLYYLLANLPPRSESEFCFGKGNSDEQFISVLKESRFWNTQKQKQFVDLCGGDKIGTGDLCVDTCPGRVKEVTA